MFALIVFDLDGTLVDSRRDIADAANDVLVECGAQPLSELAIGRMVGDGAAVLMARAFAAAGQPLPEDALARFLRCYDRRLIAHTRPYDGIVEALAALQAQSTLAVLTNKPLVPTQQILAGLHLDTYFAPSFVFGGDGPLPRKPDPGGLRALAASAGVDPDRCCLVGDSYVDWQTAQAAGTACCLAAYGFGIGSVPPAVLATAPRVVAHAAELVARLSL